MKQKVVLRVELNNERTKHKAMKTVSDVHGIQSVFVDLKEKKMVISGNIDPVCAVLKLRKCCHTEIVLVEAAKEEEKEKEKEKEKVAVKVYEAYPLSYQMIPPQYSHGYYVKGYEDNPCGCVIF
ncbi:heavy metal-associated isoprenylated plant protein 39-like [Vigna umbellata]|uniref:heavy metal-associated isoprenylated plant protein 39-like n=1 Tax=Vigna umbellata TaxID=87088 RepID=UPI001F5E9958|nr:heavy metal-associated isoprenylated plant protein 39-like [Vigna umbellata]XP_047178955.1 heavy metal-associated isoprenylated plant protein 39-like [Vigna umbellata]